MLLGNAERPRASHRSWGLSFGLLMFLLMAGPDCTSKRSRYAPPTETPEPPEGEGWYCFHSTSPHAISMCKRDLDACQKSLAQHVADKTKLEEIRPKLQSLTSGSLSPGLFAYPADDGPVAEEPEPAQEEPPSAPEYEGSMTICAIDPAACSGPPAPKHSVPTYSSCEPMAQAYCSPYYHEFNFYRKDEENHWRFLCTETAQSCDAWRELLHLHLVKRPCLTVR